MNVLSIIIVNWNAGHLLKDCLESIYRNIIKINCEIFVVDNASTDGSLEMVRKEFPQVKLVENKSNLGFAKANNQAINKSKGMYILLLNPDTIVQKDAFQNMIEFMNTHPEAGVAGSKVLYADGSLQLSCGHFPSLQTEFFHSTLLEEIFPKSPFIGNFRMTNWDHNSVREVDWVSGSCLLVRKAVITDVGLLDKAIFMYAEDIDWCYRIKNAAWKIYYLPQSKIIHLESQIANTDLTNKLRNGYQGLYYFFDKHYGKKVAILFKVLVANGMMLRMTIRSFQYAMNYERKRTRELLKAYFQVLRMVLFDLR